jgi:hypothetical protein
MMDDFQPVYFCEHVAGTVWKQNDLTGLSLAPLEPPTQTEILHQGDVTLRYGIEILQSRYLLIPGYFETENGAVKTGRAAWDFIWAKFQLYPRADVVGIRSDGKEAHLLMRNLDFGEGPKVLAYSSEESQTMLGVVTKLLLPPEAELPELLAQYASDLA